MRPRAASLLGYDEAARLILINCDDFGMAPEVTSAALAALRAGTATSATLIVPATWAADAAAQSRGEPIGVHLTMNSEWESDRWRPLTQAPSLCDPDGSLCRHPEDTCTRAVAAEVRAELRAQIEQAIAWGLEPTHLDAHMYLVQERWDFFDIYLDLATEYALPVRVSGSARQVDHPFRVRAHQRGVVCPDYLVRLDRVGSREPLVAALADLLPGLTEFHLHPAVDSPALRQLASDWPGRTDDRELLASPEFWQLVADSKATVVGYRELRDAARAVNPDVSQTD